MQYKSVFIYFLSVISFCLLNNIAIAGCQGDCINGKGRYLYNDGQVYDGSWLNGKKHGQGHFTYKDQSSYKGSWQNGLRQGQGTYTWPNGQTYKGQFVADKMNGQGIVQYANGSRYEGEIVEGVPHGQGTMYYASGQKYQGQWKNNKKHGQGEFYWPSGRQYTGEFFQGKLTGKGSYTHNGKSMEAQKKAIDPREAEKAALLYGKQLEDKKALSKVTPKTVVNKSAAKELPESNKVAITEVKQDISENITKTLPPVTKYKLKVSSEPEDAVVRILNIKPKYKPDMALLPGDYEIEVSKAGYQTQTKWLKISDKNIDLSINLQKQETQQPVQIAQHTEKLKMQQTKNQRSPNQKESKTLDANAATSGPVVKSIPIENSGGGVVLNQKKQLDLAHLKDEIERLKKQIETNQKSAASDAKITSTLPEIKQEDVAKHALIIGNSSYNYSPLKNPANDASDIALTLEKLGFDVILKTNVNQEQMEDAIADFGRDLTQGGIGLFYYAGHGVQFEGDNYLIPIDSKIKRQKDVRYKAVNLGQVLDEMGEARNGLNVAILDACRNNPLPRSYRSGHRGLARVSSPQGTLIAYATSPGATAADGDGRNGLYTKHLLKYLQQPNITVEQVLKRVARDVREESSEQQTPWMESSFTGEFYFSKEQ